MKSFLMQQIGVKKPKEWVYRALTSILPSYSSDYIRKAVSTVTGLEWPRGFQEVKVPRFHDNGTGWW
jgi:hypothetical protein